MKIWLTQHKAYFVYVYKFYFLVFNADNCFYKGQMEDCFAKKSENKVGKKKKICANTCHLPWIVSKNSNIKMQIGK